MATAKEHRYLGNRTAKVDGLDKVTGNSQFGADLMLPGMLYGKILRSPYAHARIKSINTSKAAARPGVMAVVTGGRLSRTWPEVLWPVLASAPSKCRI